MGNKNTIRRTKYHDFRDAKGKTIPYSFLAAVLGETERWIRTRLSQEKKIPTDVHAWVKRILAPGTRSGKLNFQMGRIATETLGSVL